MEPICWRDNADKNVTLGLNVEQTSIFSFAFNTDQYAVSLRNTGIFYQHMSSIGPKISY